ncbi:hypothetical protein GCM10010222_12350 [Streptomyces tanashiensis]|nr:hypothetical protein GCM10010222_12350 [Streptomyces tanashiensis]
MRDRAALTVRDRVTAAEPLWFPRAVPPVTHPVSTPVIVASGVQEHWIRTPSSCRCVIHA